MNPRYRNVNLRSFMQVVERCKADHVTHEEAWQISLDYRRELAKVRRQACPGRISRNGYMAAPLQDGTTGYFQRGMDDCLQASIATLAGIPMDQVPDLEIDKQRFRDRRNPYEILCEATQRLDRWSDQLGLDIRAQATLPKSGKWIGVVPIGEREFTDHCLIMSGRDCIFDTTQIFPPTKRDLITALDVDDIDYAITIE
jgi:hypothetical protein